MSNNIVDLLVELTRNVDEPITRIELAKRYNEKFNTELPFQKFINNQTLFTKISTANVSRMRRAKMLFLLKVPLVDPIFKAKLEEIAILDFDDKNCLTKFTLKADGSVIFSLPKKSQYVRSVERFSLDYSKRATSPIPRNPLFKKFVENGGSESEGLFIKTFDKVCKDVLDSDRSLERKVKFCFVHGLVISGDLLKEFRTIGRVYVNRKSQITGFKSSNGELNFSGKPKKPRISQRIENGHVERPEEEKVPMDQDQGAPEAPTSSALVKASEVSGRSPVVSIPKVKKAPEVVVDAPNSSEASKASTSKIVTPEAARTPKVFTSEVMDTPKSQSSQKRPIERNSDIEPAAKKMTPPKHQVIAPFRCAPRPVLVPRNLQELDLMKMVPESMELPTRAPQKTTHEAPSQTTHDDLPMTFLKAAPSRTTPEVLAQTPHEAPPMSTYKNPTQTTDADRLEALKIYHIGEALLQATYKAPPMATHDAPAPTTHEVPVHTTHEVSSMVTAEVIPVTTHEVPAKTTHEVPLPTTNEAPPKTTHEVSAPMNKNLATSAPEAPPGIPNMLKAIKQEPLDDDVLIWTAKKPKIQIKEEPKDPEEEAHYDPIPYNLNIVREEAPDAPEVTLTPAPLAHKVLEDFFRILSAQLQREHPQRFNELIQKWTELEEVLDKSKTPLKPTELVHAFQTMIDKKLKPVKVFEEGVAAPKFLKELMDNTQRFYVLNVESKEEKLMWKEMRRIMKKKLTMVTRYEVFTYDAIITCFSKMFDMIGFFC